MLNAARIAELYEELSHAMVVHFARRTFDPDVALDLTGETFARAFTARRRFRGATQEEATAWVWAIARNVLAEYHRRGAVERRALRRLAVEPPALDDEEHARLERLAGLAELRERLARELGALPDDQRAAVRLRVVEELGYPEVALRLGVTEATARARVSRGLRALRASLAPTGMREELA